MAFLSLTQHARRIEETGCWPPLGLKSCLGQEHTELDQRLHKWQVYTGFCTSRTKPLTFADHEQTVTPHDCMLVNRTGLLSTPTLYHHPLFLTEREPNTGLMQSRPASSRHPLGIPRAFHSRPLSPHSSSSPRSPPSQTRNPLHPAHPRQLPFPPFPSPHTTTSNSLSSNFIVQAKSLSYCIVRTTQGHSEDRSHALER